MKKMLKENKPILLMVCIVLFCTVLSIILLLKYFYFGNGGTKYGDRLEGIENVLITDNRISEVETSAKENQSVVEVKTTITGKIIYIRLKFDNNISLVEAKTIAVKLLEKFSDEEKKFYDFQFTLVQDATDNSSGFKIMGAKNVNGSNLVWNNNNVIEVEEE